MVKVINAKDYPKDMDFNILKERLRNRRIKWLRKKEEYLSREEGYDELQK